MYCVCISPSGKKCPYRAVYMDTQMCGVHHMFRNDLDNLNKVLPFTFSNTVGF